VHARAFVARKLQPQQKKQCPSPTKKTKKNKKHHLTKQKKQPSTKYKKTKTQRPSNNKNKNACGPSADPWERLGNKKNEGQSIQQ
jgi:hypothetical protein